MCTKKTLKIYIFTNLNIYSHIQIYEIAAYNRKKILIGIAHKYIHIGIHIKPPSNFIYTYIHLQGIQHIHASRHNNKFDKKKKLLLLKNDADNLFESGLTVNGEAGVTFFE